MKRASRSPSSLASSGFGLRRWKAAEPQGVAVADPARALRSGTQDEMPASHRNVDVGAPATHLTRVRGKVEEAECRDQRLARRSRRSDRRRVRPHNLCRRDPLRAAGDAVVAPAHALPEVESTIAGGWIEIAARIV